MILGFACQNPKCPGTLIRRVNHGMNSKGLRMHGTPKEVNKCYGKYLVEERGYTRINDREYSQASGPRLLLDRKGSPIHTGKRPQGGGRGQSYLRPEGRIL